jgi:hypothetical protein
MSEIKAGDWVRWVPTDKTWVHKFGHGPFQVKDINESYIQVYTPTHKEIKYESFFRKRFELDPFLNAVRKSRHG